MYLDIDLDVFYTINLDTVAEDYGAMYIFTNINTLMGFLKPKSVLSISQSVTSFGIVSPSLLGDGQLRLAFQHNNTQMPF
jgi:hypothetical protein